MAGYRDGKCIQNSAEGEDRGKTKKRCSRNKSFVTASLSLLACSKTVAFNLA